MKILQLCYLKDNLLSEVLFKYFSCEKHFILYLVSEKNNTKPISNDNKYIPITILIKKQKPKYKHDLF